MIAEDIMVWASAFSKPKRELRIASAVPRTNVITHEIFWKTWMQEILDRN